MRLGYNARLSLALAAVALLTVLFCWQASAYIEKTANNLAVCVAQVRGAVQADDWEAAGFVLNLGLKDWQQARPYWLGLINHQDVTNIDLALHSLQAFEQKQRADEVLNQLSLLDYYLNLVVESDKVNLSNLF